MKQIQVNIGDHIDNIIAIAISTTISTKEECQFTFNGVKVTVKPDDIQESVYNRFQEGLSENSQKFKESPEGKTYYKEIADRKKKSQELLNQAMKHWPNFQDIESVLEWCNTVFENWIIGTTLDTNKVLTEFKAAGITPNMNLSPVYDEENKSNSGLYLVGQFLEGVKTNSIPEIFAHFYDEWKKKHC